MKHVVLYHANCPDGWAAAYIAAKALPEPELVPVQHGDPPPRHLTAGSKVYILDFSYPREVLERIADEAASLIVLDHHKSARDDLYGLPYAKFDLNESGATLAWDYFHPDTPLPWWVAYIRDRDLWLREKPLSLEISAVFASHHKTIEAWDRMLAKPFQDLKSEGQAILRYQQRLIDLHLDRRTKLKIAGTWVPAVNASVLQSEIADALLRDDPPFVCAYFDLANGTTVYSLRSKPDTTDVSEVAKLYGGGGHSTAAGFRLPQGADLPSAERKDPAVYAKGTGR